MPKPNRGTALFDLLGEDTTEVSGTLKVPAWWGKRPPPTGERMPEQAAQATACAEAAPAWDGLGPPTPAGQSSPGRFLELDGECVRVSFTAKTAAIAIFAGIVVLLVAFELGSRYGEARGLQLGFSEGQASYAASAMSDIEAARNQPPATHLVKDLLAEPDGPAAEPESAPARKDQSPGRTQWVRGNTYIVVQEFSAQRVEDGRAAQKFLEEHGVATELVELSSGALQLLTTQGYNRQAPIQRRMADELLDRVHAIGEKYHASGGGYGLKGYFKTLKDDTW